MSSILCIGIITDYEITSASIFFSLSDNTNTDYHRWKVLSNWKHEKYQSSGLFIPTEITGSWNSGSLVESADLIPVPVRNIPFSPLLSKGQPLVTSHPLVHNGQLLFPNNLYLCFMRRIALWRVNGDAQISMPSTTDVSQGTAAGTFPA